MRRVRVSKYLTATSPWGTRCWFSQRQIVEGAHPVALAKSIKLICAANRIDRASPVRTNARTFARLSSSSVSSVFNIIPEEQD